VVSTGVPTRDEKLLQRAAAYGLRRPFPTAVPFLFARALSAKPHSRAQQQSTSGGRSIA